MSNIEDLLNIQGQLAIAIEKLLVNFKKDGAERKTPQHIKRRLDTLEQYWKDFQSNHITLCESETQDYVYFAEKHFERVANIYNEGRKHLYQSLPVQQEEKLIIKPATPLFNLSMDWNKESQPPPTEAGPATGIRKEEYTSDIPTPRVNTQTVERGNQSKLEEMYRKQQSNLKAFQRAINNIKLELLTERWEFEDVLRTIQGRWNAVDSLHWEIDSEQISEKPEYEKTYNLCEQKYEEIKKHINIKMWATSHREKSTPTMELPIFNGNYHQWMSFKDLFTETIHKNNSISNAQKMQFLKSKVKGEAEKLIQHLKISTENYQVCWDILNHRYNNKKLIFSSHVNILLGLPTMQQQSAISIKRLHDNTKECLHAIQNLGVNISTWDPLIVHLLTQKLDADSHNDYIEHLVDPRELPTMTEFLSFLEAKFTALESSRRKQEANKPAQNISYDKKFTQNKPSSSYQTPRNENHFKENQIYQSTSNKNNYQGPQRGIYQGSQSKNYHAFATYTAKCPCCNNNHDLFRCTKFLGMTPETKLATISSRQICTNCLYKHYGNPCLSEKRCKQCNNEHNTILHEAFVGKKKVAANESHVSKYAGHVGHEELKTLLSTALIMVQTKDGSYIKLRALIDPGAEISLCTENAAQRLGLKRHKYSGSIFGVGILENDCKGFININVASIHTDYTFTAMVFVLNRVVNDLPSRSFDKSSWTHLEGLPLADPEFNKSQPIDILLGADIFSDIILESIIRKDDTTPIALKTHLGYILNGKMKSYQCNVIVNNVEDISRFWAIEDIADTSDEISSEDQFCINQYKSETYRQADGRYVVRLPLKPDIKEKLGESRQRAVAQFYQLEKKFMKNEKVSRDYKSFINEYQDLGHMRECERDTTPSNYLPHHAVQRAESSTSALRVVYHASAPTTSGYSLNDLMYSGPNLQSDLFTLILRWRQYKIALNADIEKMFRQILCNEEDQLYQKIIWRDNPKQLLREYALTTVTYGTKSAPFLAMMTLKQLALDEAGRYPEAAKVLERDFYMDDLLSGAHSIESAKKLQADLINLLRAGGFNLRKWSSNHPELLENISNVKQPLPFDFKHQQSQKTLGLRWNPHEDEFSFKFQMETLSTAKVTKRSLLSDISKVFDPLGWLCPITTKLKLLFQSVWKEKLDWSDEVPENIDNEWRSIKQNMKDINHITIPRWLRNKENDIIEYHGFCDASEKAYACVIYSVIRKNGSNAETALPEITIVAAKSKLVPSKKSVTLPRLELCAAELLSKLLKKVMTSLSNYETKISCWTDSTAVLGWVQGDIQRWKPFVSNRVQKIREIAPAGCWRYVKSSENPADSASRGIHATQLKDLALWWKGPSWLSTLEEKPQEVTYTTDQDVKVSKQANVTTYQANDVISDLIIKHSNINRMTRILAWVLRALSLKKPTVPYLTVPELRKAKHIIIKHVQLESFREEINSLNRHGHVKTSSDILSFNPFLDSKGLLRVRGRIGKANIDPNMKHPLIIPHKGHITDLLIENAHKLTLHGGARLTLCQLRYQFWVIGGNRAVKKHINKCVTCIRYRAMKQAQIMGDLPAARCNPTRPFYHTGTDYTGFVEIKSNKGRGIKTTKGYIAVFVCMVTKAVHLEAVSDLSSSAFLSALRRMAARRGAPHHIYSDCGTNYVGASRRLNEDFVDLKNTLDEKFFSAISEMDIQWHFNCPSWPSAGGIWESAVKSLKHHLRRVMGEQKLTYEELSTLLAQVEACLNSRPLCAITEDIDDINFLTPSHFLSSGPNLTIIETEKDERTRWQLVQKMVSDLWKRWQSEYLTQLSKRSKWHTPKENMKVGDVVIIHDANLPAGKWALGRVETAHPGHDGYVRVVSLKTKNGVIKRPITKLSKLPVTQEPAKDSKSEETEPVERKPDVKQRRTRRSPNLLTLALMLLFTFISPAQCEHRLTNINNQQGVYFDKISNMRLIRDEWKLIVYYDMGPYWQGQKVLQEYLLSLEETCTKAQKISKCDVVLIQLRHGFAELEYYNTIMLAQQVTRSTRHRRGLFNGVGYVANGLFGMLDERFAQQYEKDINLVKDNEKHLALLWKNQTSVVEAEYNLLKRVEEAMDKQHKIMNHKIIELEKAANVLTKEVIAVEKTNEFMLSSIVTNSLMENLKSIQETLLETITDIYHGKFNFHLLTPAQLREELSVISGQLSKDLAIPIDNIQTDLQYMYHLLKVKTRMTTKYLIFEIRIPLISRDNFEIYKLMPIPQQFKETMISISPISVYVAMNIQKDSYIPLSETEVKDCNRHDTSSYLCPLQTPIYHMDGDDNLCIKDKDQSKCKGIIQPCTDTWERLSKQNNYLYFSCGHRTIRIICEDQVTAEQISGAGIISLGDGCIVKSESLTIFAHKYQTNNLNIQPLLIEIDMPSINHIFNLSIPILEDDLISSNSTSGIKGQILEIGKQIEDIKVNEAKGVLADRISSHDIHQYVLVYILLGVATVVFAVYVWRRLRLRCSARIPPGAPRDAPADFTVRYSARNENREEARPQHKAKVNALSTARGLDKATSPIIGVRFTANE